MSVKCASSTGNTQETQGYNWNTVESGVKHHSRKKSTGVGFGYRCIWFCPLITWVKRVNLCLSSLRLSVFLYTINHRISNTNHQMLNPLLFYGILIHAKAVLSFLSSYSFAEHSLSSLVGILWSHCNRLGLTPPSRRLHLPLWYNSSKRSISFIKYLIYSAIA